MADTPSEPATFSGFEPDALQFLADLADNNDRGWFKPRKTDYERLLKEPMESLCVALGDRFEALRLPLVADPSRSPFRIYRDVRFSKDKSPYKTGLGARFPWDDSGGDPKRHLGGVGGYFHLAPGNIFVGGGMWHPERERLAAFREKVDRDPNVVLRAIEDERFRSVFGSVIGDSLTRNPKGFPADHPYGHLLRLKDVGLQPATVRPRGLLPGAPRHHRRGHRCGPAGVAASWEARRRCRSAATEPAGVAAD